MVSCLVLQICFLEGLSLDESNQQKFVLSCDDNAIIQFLKQWIGSQKEERHLLFYSTMRPVINQVFIH